jgi:hypothetical protein
MKQTAGLFELANERTQLPSEYISIEHRKEKSLLKVRFSNHKVRYSKIDMEKGVIYDKDADDNLISVEILDFVEPTVIEETAISETPQLTEAEQLRKEMRAAKRKRRRQSGAGKSCCRFCGKPKHRICLEHHSFKKTEIEKLLLKPFRKTRYYARKMFFTVARKLGFVEDKPKRI